MESRNIRGVTVLGTIGHSLSLTFIYSFELYGA